MLDSVMLDSVMLDSVMLDSVMLKTDYLYMKGISMMMEKSNGLTAKMQQSVLAKMGKCTIKEWMEYFRLFL
jgi:hypothetical protein